MTSSGHSPEPVETPPLTPSLTGVTRTLLLWESFVTLSRRPSDLDSRHGRRGVGLYTPGRYVPVNVPTGSVPV